MYVHLIKLVSNSRKHRIKKNKNLTRRHITVRSILEFIQDIDLIV